MKRTLFALLLLAFSSASAHAQSYAGRSSGDIRVVSPYKMCVGEDDGTDVCMTQSGKGQAKVNGGLSAKTTNGIANVIVYGADPTGVADSTSAIQAALTAAVSSKADVYVPAGTYKTTGALTLLDGQHIHGDGDGSVLSLSTTNQHGFDITGGHAVIRDLKIVKVASVTGVTGIVINPNGNLITSYNKIDNVRIEGNGASDLLTDAILVQSGTPGGCVSGSDCGAFYNQIDHVDVRYATNCFHFTGTTANVGANGNSGTSDRCGDSTNGFRVTRGEGNRFYSPATEGNTGESFWVETDATTNNNDNQFIGIRLENPSALHDIRVDATSFENLFLMGVFNSANILNNGTSTVFLGSNYWNTGWMAYSDVNGVLKFNPVGGVQLTGSTTMTLGQTTVASLPTASSNAGAMVLVTDSTAVASEGQTCAGSSTNKAVAISNGSGWKCF